MKQICLCHIHQAPTGRNCCPKGWKTYRPKRDGTRAGRTLQLQPHPSPHGAAISSTLQSLFTTNSHTQVQNGGAMCKPQSFQNTAGHSAGQDKMLEQLAQVLRPSLKQHRCNCQAPVISLKRYFEVLKAFRSFLLDTFMFSIHCVAAQTLTCELSDHTSVQSGDQSSDHSGCISAVGLFLLKAAGH